MSSAEIYRVMGIPVFQNKVYSEIDEAKKSATGNLVLLQDEFTGLIYNSEFNYDIVGYDKNYDNEQGNSFEFKKHMSSICELLSSHFTGGSVIEIGCGKGNFLSLLTKAGFVVTGADPAYDGSDHRIIKDYYSPRLCLRGDAVVLRHVLEHIHDPLSFLEMLRDANQGGLIYIEVPCLEWIRQHRAWFDIFYEHVNYFRLQDLTSMFGDVRYAKRSFGGQYLSVIADLSTLRRPRRRANDVFRLSPDFMEGIDLQASYVNKALARPGAVCAVWGAASKGVIFSLLVSRYGAYPTFAIDINPAKQERFMPISGIQILSPTKGLAQLPDGSSVFIMNDNYTQEIRTLSGDRLTYHSVTC